MQHFSTMLAVKSIPRLSKAKFFQDNLLSSRRKIQFTPYALVGTAGASAELPKLPVPPTEDTMERYLDSIRAVASEEDYKNTERKINEFLADKNLVSEVEALLNQRQQEKDNWAYEYWIKDMYLGNPLALPVNSNPGWVIKSSQDDAARHEVSRLFYLSKCAVGLMGFKKIIENSGVFRDGVPQDYGQVLGGAKQPLCMEQFNRVFNTYRHPGQNSDTLEITDGREARFSEHIIVMKKGRIFEVKVKNCPGDWINVESLATILLQIKNKKCSNLPMDKKIPLLTAADRDKWAKHREIIRKDPVGADTLRLIETCLFVICLDETTQNPTDVSRSQASLFSQMLHGEGPYKNGANRWFDKTIQLVSAPDGALGVCYEHSVAEGVAIASIISQVVQKVDKEWDEQDLSSSVNSFESSPTALWTWREVNFGSCAEDPEVKARVMEEAEEFKGLCDDTDVEVLKFCNFGKGFMKRNNCSPDAFVQMSLQLAYFKLHGNLTFTYESASTRRFRRGRVDVIRASHQEALEWVKAMEEDEKDHEIRLNLFNRAIAKQTKLIVENISGLGVDTPLLGIREACKEVRPNQEFGVFTDKVYKDSVSFKLSTSQVPIALPNSYMGYGAVVPDGYGISYNLQEEDIIFCISSFFSSEETSSLDMANCIQHSLDQMKKMIELDA